MDVFAQASACHRMVQPRILSHKAIFWPFFFPPKKVNFKRQETVMVSLELLGSAMYNKSVLVCGLLAQ